jgi:competence protein ComEA
VSQAMLRHAHIGLAVLAGLTLAAPAAAQSLPEGAGRQTTIKVCGTCHPAERGAAVKLTRDGWREVLAKMTTLGARGTEAEMAEVLDYLSTHFKGEAMAPLNLNRATSIELEAIVGMLRRESAAWIAARQKAPCATLDDLKKVPGVDFARIEKRRDRLVCF